MEKLSIDIETYSSVDLARNGVYAYTEAEDFDIILFGYSIDDGPARTADTLKGEQLPDEVLRALTDETVTKWAFNAQFERICISAWLKKNYPHLIMTKYLDPRQWKCSRIWSAYMGLPLSLESAGAILELKDQKIDEGAGLIRFFSVPVKNSKKRVRNFPEDDPDKWYAFRSYNIRDVDTETSIQDKLKGFPVPDDVWEEYWLDQEINDRGVMVDMDLVNAALKINEKSREDLLDRAREITGLENPNSATQLKKWLADTGLPLDSINKKEVAAQLDNASAEQVEVLELRQKLAKSSLGKYQAMKRAVCNDGRAHGMFQFYGANRTGRWAGRLIQLQNLPRNYLPDLGEARELVKEMDYDSLEMLYENVPDTLSQLIRTSFIPKPGYKFVVADFSSIEARVLAWLADEQWRIQAFANGEDIYCASASQMFGVPVVKNGINGDLRQKGKIAELALGYGGAVGALKAMGALDMGMEEGELKPLVDTWRKANPGITKFWQRIGDAALRVVDPNRGTNKPVKVDDITFRYSGKLKGLLIVTLPSGRELHYLRPHIGQNQYGNDNSILYGDLDRTRKWSWDIETYGPKLTENIVQATARDLLANAMKNLAKYNIVMHIHDEIVMEVEKDTSKDEIIDIMTRPPEWAYGIRNIPVSGFETEFYKKD